MYESFFGLSERPFLAAPRPDRYFAGSTIEAARLTLSRVIERGEGVGLVIGPSGTGKTLLCALLAEQFHSRMRVAVTPSGRLATRRALLQSILFELGRPFRKMDEGELRLALVDYVGCDERCPGGLLLVVDEAQCLPLRLLEELRLITNLVRKGVPRVRLLLAGAPALEERFASPKLELFAQRFAARAYLDPLNRSETADYVVAQLVACGGSGQRPFSDNALEAIYRATDGVPRLVNQVCDHVMLLAAAGGRNEIDGAGIEEAWADLQQLPLAWNEPAARSRTDDGSHDDIIEFGGLTDEAQEPTEVDEIPMAAAEQPSTTAENATELLADISSQLDALDEDFEPAGAIRPEVELIFPVEPAGIDESFDEEEVVIDHYAELDASRFGSGRVVSSLEGHELAQVLEPLIRQPREARLRLAEAESEEEPLIVVEEDPEVVELVASQPAPPVRKQEYSQLFAQLRES